VKNHVPVLMHMLYTIKVII